METTQEIKKEVILTRPGSLRYQTASTPGRPSGDAPNVANSRDIPTELAKRLDSMIHPAQMTLNPKMSAVPYLRIAGMGMAVAS
jgi:hypothetical protein